MSTLLKIKTLALTSGDDYLKDCMKLIDSYLDKHGNAKIKTLIEDNYVSVYDKEVLLLRVSTMVLNKPEMEDK